MRRFPVAPESLANDATIRALFASLLRESGLQTIRTAFIVPDGRAYRRVAGPPAPSCRRPMSHAAVPRGTIAIVHTHPEELPFGSEGDRETARRLAIPIFVLTPRNIVVVTPEGENTPIVLDQWWAPTAA